MNSSEEGVTEDNFWRKLNTWNISKCDLGTCHEEIKCRSEATRLKKKKGKSSGILFVCLNVCLRSLGPRRPRPERGARAAEVGAPPGGRPGRGRGGLPCWATAGRPLPRPPLPLAGILETAQHPEARPAFVSLLSPPLGCKSCRDRIPVRIPPAPAVLGRLS